MSRALPRLLATPIVDSDGRLTIPWLQFLQNNQDVIYAAATMLQDHKGPLRLDGTGTSAVAPFTPNTGFQLADGRDISEVLSMRSAVKAFTGSYTGPIDITTAYGGAGMFVIKSAVPGYLRAFAHADGATQAWNGVTANLVYTFQTLNCSVAITDVWRIT